MEDSKSIPSQWLALLAGIALAPMGAYAASDAGVITVGADLIPPQLCIVGYPPIGGAYSPTGLTGGKTVQGLFAVVVTTGPGTCLGNPTGHFTVSGFSSDPGKSWLTSVTCNSITKTGASASYSYSSGSAGWSWTITDWGFSSNIYSQLSCTIVHN